MPLPLLGAGIIGAGSLLGSIFSNSGAKNRQKLANKQNINFWNMQNEYNNPSAQMERLRKAGLNPNLIYGGSPSSATGNAGAISPSKPAPYKIENPMQKLTQFADIRQKEATTNNLKELGTVIEQDKLLRKGQVKGQGIANKFAPALAGSSLQVQQAQVNQLAQKTIGQDIDNQIRGQAKQSLMKEIHFRVLNAKANLTGQNLKNELMKYEKELNAIGIQKDDAWYFRIMGKLYQEFGNAIPNKFKN